MHNDLTTQLKKLRGITPDPDFSRRSKSVILALHSHPHATMFRMPFALFTAGVVAMVLLVAVVVFPATRPSVSISSLNADRLAQELNTLNISVQLKEIRYQQVSNQEIASAINEIGDTRTRHLNSDVLRSEQERIEPQKTANPEIDQLLEQVIF